MLLPYPRYVSAETGALVFIADHTRLDKLDQLQRLDVEHRGFQVALLGRNVGNSNR